MTSPPPVGPGTKVPQREQITSEVTICYLPFGHADWSHFARRVKFKAQAEDGTPLYCVTDGFWEWTRNGVRMDSYDKLNRKHRRMPLNEALTLADKLAREATVMNYTVDDVLNERYRS